MKVVKTEEAVGHVLCQDLTQIIPGKVKGPVFRKGHVVQAEDIPVLLSIGKEHLYVWEKQEGILHEDEAAEILCAACKGAYMSRSEAKEGKIELTAECDGVLKVDKQALYKVNSLGQMMIAARHGNFAVKKGDKLAGTRIIPLVIEEEKMEPVKEIAKNGPILQILPFKKKKVGVITTGNEVFYGRIQDAFTPVIEKKLAEYGAEIAWHVILNDDHEKITAAILDMLSKGAEFVICTGGMSVDPDDKTPLAIKNTGSEIISYGAPVLPGAMFLLSYYNGTIPVVGLPGCVMYAKRTIFDLVLPRIMADDKITDKELAALGEGGLCLNCPVCTFPNCGFGKGSMM